jgi:hypothetical protein
MKPSTIAIWAFSGLALATGAAAQQRAPDAPPGAAAPSETVAISEAELDTFATIYVDLLATAAKFQPEIDAAPTEQKAAEVRAKMQTESLAKVTQRGWTPEKFNITTEAINRDPKLADRAVKLIQEKS